MRSNSPFSTGSGDAPPQAAQPPGYGAGGAGIGGSGDAHPGDGHSGDWPSEPGAEGKAGGDHGRHWVKWVGGAAAVLVLVAGSVYVGATLFGDDVSPPPAPATTQTTSAPEASEPGYGPLGSTTPDGRVVVRDVTLQQGGVPRKYLIVQPTDLADGEEVPLVLALHGIGVDRFGMKAAADWEEAVAEDRFIAVFPEGSLGSWNAGPCCPPATLVGAADLGFLDLVVDDVTKAGHVNPDRIHATGFSNGAMMVYQLACQRSDRYASVLPMAGVNINACKPTRPMPTLHMHGDPDPTIPYDGSFSLANLLSGRRFPAVPDSVQRWATDQGCDPEAEVEVSGSGKSEVTTMNWSGCEDGVGVELITYPGNGHSWPRREVDGLTEIREFFDLSG